MKKVLYFFFLVGLFSCEQQEEELIDLKDIIPESENYGDDQEVDETVKDTLDKYFDIRLSSDLAIPVRTIDLLNQPMFPDRFSPRYGSKLILKGEGDSIVFCQWVYKDSIKTMNALFNWLDCFGPKCNELKYRTNEKMQPDNLLLFINDTSITYLSSFGKLDELAWQKYLEQRNGVDQWDNVVIQKKRSKSVWYSYGPVPMKKENQFIPYKP